ncbi:hypothetical protein DFP72DRAFT_1079040 [Ephemerocybe angulata]|uniref:Fungal-type protein kinase domain-containing protein n=1 Tax=Ephemerocybe angulata TaxID=980116 RepID=A0A8H6HDE2_9AGAR|nr:hypothetical protein DFP72DRAFT_1079040 [Tulosesus angulatus]
MEKMIDDKTAKLASFEDIQRETKGRIVSAKERWATTMYSESVPEEMMKKIKAKLNITNGRFNDVPKDPNMKSDLYDPLVNIIQSIITASGNGKYKNSTREAMHTRGKRLHKLVVNSEISPDIVIKATGNSFELPRTDGLEGVDASLGYTNVTSVIEVKLDHTTNDDEDLRVARREVQRMGVHAKEIFAQQPNRLFIRFLVITESRVRLIQFDRAGVVHSPLINYHDDPDILIRLVVGLSSIPEVDLGLDDTVRWNAPEGRKAHGAVMMFDEKTEKYTKYRMRNLDPFFKRDELFGRATRMWDVADADGQKLLVKDAWIGTRTTPEHVSLKKAVELLGVQQLVDHEDRTGTEFGEIDYLRPSPEKGDFYDFENRIFHRIITVRYGEPINSFKTEAQVLAVLRDAIAAHERLVNAGILHCDISQGNILFGGSNAPEGICGILIDLDVAMEIMYDKKPIDSRTVGTRSSQSQLLLRGQGLPYRPAHDYLDDLESFFWVLIHIIFDHVQHSQKWAKGFIALCNSTDNLDSGGVKRAFLDGDLLDSQIPDCWTQECKDMVIAFHGFMGSIAIQKERIIGTMTEEWDSAPMHELHAQMAEHYGEMLEMIDEALGAPGSGRALPLA